jgi:hypothetical protein
MRAAATMLAPVGVGRHGEARKVTLLELVRAVGEVTTDDREVVATVLHMLRSGSVRLCGCLRNEPLDSFDD